jgi:hypothetical protein
LDVDEEARAQEHRELARVELRQEHLVERREHLAEIGRERVQVAQVDRRHREPVGARRLDRRRDRAVRAAPADHEQVAAVVAGHLDRRQLVRDPSHLLLAQLDHARVVDRIVGDVAGVLLLGETADPVLETRRARDRPRARERLGVALVGLEALRIGAVVHRHAREAREIRDLPRLCAVREVGV